MFLQEFREDFVLALQFLFQQGDPPVLVVAGAAGAVLECGSGVLEELLLPTVEHRGVNAVLVAQIRNRSVFEEMEPKDGDLLRDAEAIPSFLGHGKTSARDCSLFERLVLPIPTEAKHNEQKTRLCRLPEETIDFLGYTLGRNYDCRTGESYLGPRPAQKKVDRLCSAINELTTRRKAWRDVEELISRINRKLRGWSNYFSIGTVSKAYRNINSHTRYRVRQWLCAKFKEQGQGKKRFSNPYLHQKLGLHQLERTSRQRFVGERV